MTFEKWVQDLDRREAEAIQKPAPKVDDRPIDQRYPLSHQDYTWLTDMKNFRA
jgi:hypothetical protein